MVEPTQRGGLTSEQIDAFAKKLDKSIQVPLVPDFAEVYVFKGAIMAIDAFVLSRLGEPIYSLINDVTRGVENGTELQELIDRLVFLALKEVPMPVVSPSLQETIYRAAITLIVTAMYKGRDINSQAQIPDPGTPEESTEMATIDVSDQDFKDLVTKVATEMVRSGQVVAAPGVNPDLRENHGSMGAEAPKPLG